MIMKGNESMKKRMLALMLLFAFLLSLIPMTAFADSTTTTYETVYKDLSDNTEIYAVTDTPGSDYPYYNAKWEPKGGVYYGRIATGGKIGSGWGVVNSAQLENESAVSFYYSLGDTYGLKYWSYLYGPVTADQEHILLINLNFDGEANDCTAVVNGTYDQQLTTDFKYLNTLSEPVFIRIGGEVNVWTAAVNASDYISAYRHIAELARSCCPNAALVFSPNYSSAYQVDMDAFYPGDSYVDWIGTSLYYNRYANNGDTQNDAFYGVGEIYADPMLNIQQTVNLAKLHSKPIVITESGAANKKDGQDLSDFAASRIEKAYSFLTMVYPQIKCMIYSDSAFDSTTSSYTIYDNQAVSRAYDDAVSQNPTLVHRYQDTGSYYTKLSAYSSGWAGVVQLAAYTYGTGQLTAKWYIDGNYVASSDSYPYSYSLDTEILTSGSHTLKVQFSNGAAKSYRIKVGNDISDINFTDVAPKAWYADEVQWAAENGITTGTSATTFSPEEICNRAQVVTFLWRASGSPKPTSTKNPFSDVKEGTYYYDAVLWAVENGITIGTSATTFAPNDSCTRGQVVTFLHRTAGTRKPATQKNPFSDVKNKSFYYDAVLWAVGEQITSGIDATHFAPNNSCSRAQIVTFLYRYMN